MKKYWECECCGSLIVTNVQDSAEDYQCPQCIIMKCKQGKYCEISKECFCKLSDIKEIK